jgi:hypothetical protein
MKHRMRRIAWSVAWGVVAVLLCVLWVRSYSRDESLYVRLSNKHIFMIASLRGELSAARSLYNPDAFLEPWQIRSRVMSQPARNNRLQDLPWYHGVIGFGYTDSVSIQAVGVPYWFVLTMSALLCWSSHKFHFCLRTLLIATTLVAVALGLIGWAAK